MVLNTIPIWFAGTSLIQELVQIEASFMGQLAADIECFREPSRTLIGFVLSATTGLLMTDLTNFRLSFELKVFNLINYSRNGDLVHI